MVNRFYNLYFNPRVITVLLLGFSSGLPLVLVGSTLQAWYTMSGVSIMTIGMLGLVAQPYTWKFLWAPLLDWLNIPYLGRRRGWIALGQMVIAVCLAVMSFHQPHKHPFVVALLAVAIAFFSATQDAAIDAYRTELLSSSEQGAGAASYSLGYRIAMLIAGALALVLAQQFSWHVTYLVMAVLMLLCGVITFVIPNVITCPSSLTLKQAVISPLVNFWCRPHAFIIIIFISTYKLTDAFALSLNSYFLLHVLKFSLLNLGEVSKLAGLGGSILGSVLGGVWLPRFGLYKSLLWFGVLQSLSALLFVILFFVGKNFSWMAISVFGENFCSGLSSVAFIVYLTLLCDKRFTAAQYALLSAIASVGRVSIGPLAAFWVKTWGWVSLYSSACIIGFLPLIILVWLSKRDKVLISGNSVEDIYTCSNVCS